MNRPALVSALRTLVLLGASANAFVACTSPPLTEEMTQSAITCAKPKTVLFLNFEGGQIQSGKDDATTNTSGVVSPSLRPIAFPAFVLTAQQRADTIAIVRKAFERLNVEVVDARPTSGRYTMVMIGGREANIRINLTGAAGQAILDCGNRSDANIAFAYGEVIRDNPYTTNPLPEDLAQGVVHEAGHTFGLVHVNDPTSTMNVAGVRTRTPYFNDFPMPLYEKGAEACDGTTMQNDLAVLLENLGPAGCTPPADAAPTPEVDAGITDGPGDARDSTTTRKSGRSVDTGQDELENDLEPHATAPGCSVYAPSDHAYSLLLLSMLLLLLRRRR